MLTLLAEPTQQQLVTHSRTYILRLIGEVLIPHKSQNRVHLMYLPLLATFEWDSTCLAHLYREICRTILSIIQKNGRMYNVVVVLDMLLHVIHSTKGRMPTVISTCNMTLTYSISLDKEVESYDFLGSLAMPHKRFKSFMPKHAYKDSEIWSACVALICFLVVRWKLNNIFHRKACQLLSTCMMKDYDYFLNHMSSFHNNIIIKIMSTIREDFISNLIGADIQTSKSTYAYKQSMPLPLFAFFHQTIVNIRVRCYSTPLSDIYHIALNIKSVFALVYCNGDMISSYKGEMFECSSGPKVITIIDNISCNVLRKMIFNANRDHKILLDIFYRQPIYVCNFYVEYGCIELNHDNDIGKMFFIYSKFSTKCLIELNENFGCSPNEIFVLLHKSR
ncbi:Serine/threonine-protein phosphatase 7 long form [Glycine max]|nr:Serine/threonine-protein phosphatase 7 long form [Glycine max]